MGFTTLGTSALLVPRALDLSDSLLTTSTGLGKALVASADMDPMATTPKGRQPGGILVNPSTPSSTPPWAMATSNQTSPRPLPHRNLTCRLLKRVRRRNAMVAFSSRANFPLGCDQGNVYEIFHILNLKCMLDDTIIK